VRTEPTPGVDVFTYPARDGQRIHVAWSLDGDPHRLPVAKGTRVLDVMGNEMHLEGDMSLVTIDAEPIYLIATSP